MAVLTFKEFSGGAPVAPLTNPGTDVVEDAAQERPGFFQGVGSAFRKRVDKAADAQLSDQDPFSKVFQTLGQGAAFAGDIAFEGVKAVTPNVVEDVVAENVQAVAGTQPVMDAMQAYTVWKESHPEAAGNLEAAMNIAGLAVGGVGGKAGAEVVGGAAKRTVTGAAQDIASTVRGVDMPGVPRTPGGVAEKFSDAMTPIEKGVESVLNPTRLIPKEELPNIPMEQLFKQAETKSAKLDGYVKQAEKATSDFSQKTPLQQAGDKAGEALIIIQNKLAKQGQLKKDALGEVGAKTVGNIGVIRSKLLDDLREKVGVKVVKDAEGNIKVKSAEGRIAKIAFDPADQRLIRDAVALMVKMGQKPTVRQLDDAVDALQDLLYKRKGLTAVPVNGQVEGVLKQITGQLNGAVKKVAGEQYRKANSKSAYFIDTFEKLNKALGEEGVRGASLMKQLFSPTGEKPRRLFEDIKKLTGIDLFEEATLAKFVMENVGDARQASLLEEVIRGRTMSPMGFVEKAAEKLLDKTRDPIGKARRVIKDIPGGNLGTKLDMAYTKAPAAKEYIDKVAEKVAAGVGGRVKTTTIKGRERAVEKILTDYRGDVSRITDLARNTVIVPGMTEFSKAFKALKKFKSTESVKMVPPEGDVLGYSGAMAKVKAPNGLVAEIQLNTPWMIYAKENERVARNLLGEQFEEIKKTAGTVGGLGHKYYEQFRSMSVAEQMSDKGQALAQKSKAYYTSIREKFEL